MPPRDPIIAVLGPGGLLAKNNPNYEHRSQQIEMARLVRRALEERRYALIEAGTGTGKTLAYLLPCLLSGRKVVVSTATKTLQEQIVNKDLPLLEEIAALDFTATVMKGRTNYLCLMRLDKTEEAPLNLSASDYRVLEQLRKWAQVTQTGDRAELDLPERMALWKELTATSETCLGQSCPRHDDCFVFKMRKRASESDLLIVNHHLFFADLALKTSAKVRGAEVIPRFDAVVFDEAHALEDVATDFFGISVSDFRIDELARDIETRTGEDLALLGLITPLERLENTAQLFFHEVGTLLPRARSAGGASGSTDHSVRLTTTHGRALQKSCQAVQDILLALKARLAKSEDPEIESLARRCSEIADDLKFLTGVDKAGFVYWAQARVRSTFVCAAPVDIAQDLRERLFSRVDTAVFASATLATQGNLDFVKRRLGLSDTETGEDCYSVESLILDSPFDYENQAALYAPVHLPEPTDPAFVASAADEIEALCRISSGRAFVLFTSLRNMREAHRLLRERLPFQVLLQGERPKHALIHDFKERPSVLFASQSFWEGIDVPGEALSLVIIDKLPFASPADPLVAARIDTLKSKNADAFGQYQVPHAALSLRQGFGRLIRTRRDRGIVAILDRRLRKKTYGKVFIESLPRCRVLGELDAVAAWWKESMDAQLSSKSL